MSNSVQTLEISTLYSSLIGTLDEEKFLKLYVKKLSLRLSAIESQRQSFLPQMSRWLFIQTRSKRDMEQERR